MLSLERVEEAGSFYDRIARFYDWTFKVNRYRQSVEEYLASVRLPLPNDARVLDAGCGTGLLTLTMLDALHRPARITAIDLSAKSLVAAEKTVRQEQAEDTRRAKHQVIFAQANMLQLPFPDNAFDFVTTCGALEYIPVDAGLKELARVTTPGGYLLHIPIRPTPISHLWEIIFRFRLHPPHAINESTRRYFNILDVHSFPPTDPIGWTKHAILAQKPVS